jgi:hypothetical protein
MFSLHYLCGLTAAAIAFAAFAPGAVAQDNTFKSTCQGIGNRQRERR